MKYYKPTIILIIAWVISLFWLLNLKNVPISLAQEPEDSTVWDAPMIVPSPEETSSWFPDLAVDSQGRVHVAWNETNHLGMNYAQPGDIIDPETLEKVFYSVWDGQKWLPYNDIIPSQRDIIRQDMTIDSRDIIHLVYGWFNSYYKQAAVGEALSAAKWSEPKLINSRRVTYMSDIEAYKDVLHLVYDDQGGEEGECPNCADIFYRRSTDHGLTWSSPEILFPTTSGSSRAQLEVDRAGNLYVAWDEGWDRLMAGGTSPQYSIYVHSRDEGLTWSSPTIVSYPSIGNSQLTVGADGQGGVMLVWRNDTLGTYYYMWSTDYGESWSPPKNISGFFIEDYEQFSMYDMETDSAGHIHLLIPGRATIDQENTYLYHLEWDGRSWSTPFPLYTENWFAQYPRLVIDRGNQLHAIWYIREDMFEDRTPHQVWYAHGQSLAPAEMPVKVEPTATPLPTTTPLPTSTLIPTPTVDPATLYAAVPDQLTGSLYTDYDEIFVIVQSLLPAVFIIGIIIIVVRMWRR
jgi:hypothetical protein